MPICYITPDGSHVRGCDKHTGEHPYDWCVSAWERRMRAIGEAKAELTRLQTHDYGDEWNDKLLPAK